jgi:UDP-N-acetyl-D-mannosaminuronic acid dehydrogenase
MSLPTICVLGLGYIGLPTASMFAVSGHDVLGVDPDPAVQAALRGGRLQAQEPDLETLVSAALNSGRLQVRTAPAPADVFVIAVPTPFVGGGGGENHAADLAFVRQAAADIVPHLRRGNLVVLESTVPPGTTRDTLVPLLATSGLRPGVDVCVAHCPERVLPGRILLELVENDRLAGGLTPACAERAAELYESFVKGTVIRTEATTAELAKVMENTYRDVNVALANEFALIAERVGVNVWSAIELANRHPRVQILRPGPGVGGHCVAVDPWFLVDAAPEQARLVRTAREVNDGMPRVVAERIAALVEPGAPIALLGATYKAEIDDVRESPALAIAELLVGRGFDVRLCDPHLGRDRAGLAAPLLPLEQAVRDAHLVALLVDHAAFVRHLDVDLVAALVGRRQVLDARGVLDTDAWAARGFRVEVLGAPSAAGSRSAAASSRRRPGPAVER